MTTPEDEIRAVVDSVTSDVKPTTLVQPIRHDGHGYSKPWALDLIVDLYDANGANIGCIDAALADVVVAALNNARPQSPRCAVEVVSWGGYEHSVDPCGHVLPCPEHPEKP